ncbi:MAG: dihydrodipicolinate synthase family protein [Betaproteobacteria bacterium RIFCSPLOWO2_02_FULL_65_24]|nr:MAG: dihydrodipicolinate synthase family protein [Betaproteobacteria bacterium RIFCSPLOWO2_02_FULL_65_24]
MKYRKADAKDYARQHLRGVWAAALTPFTEDLRFDEEGFRRNMRHWIRDLALDGLFVGGKQGEFYAMSLEERKRNFEIAVEETQAAGNISGTMLSCSDQSLDTVVELARHAQNVGADYVVVHTPLLYFGAHTDETVFEYYRYIAEKVEIGVALWNQPPDCGYVISPELCVRMAAGIPNIVAIKYSVPREIYSKLTRLAGDKLIVSSSSEEEWLDNIVELGWQVYLCSTPPFLMQTKHDRRMNEYTALAMKGELERAREVRASLEPVRQALKKSRPAGKPQAQQKYWQQLLGQAGGPVRRPLLQLTDPEKAAIRSAFEGCGLALGTAPARSL